jgi:hypothetical protein
MKVMKNPKRDIKTLMITTQTMILWLWCLKLTNLLIGLSSKLIFLGWGVGRSMPHSWRVKVATTCSRRGREISGLSRGKTMINLSKWLSVEILLICLWDNTNSKNCLMLFLVDMLTTWGFGRNSFSMRLSTQLWTQREVLRIFLKEVPKDKKSILGLASWLREQKPSFLLMEDSMTKFQLSAVKKMVQMEATPRSSQLKRAIFCFSRLRTS